MAHPTSALLHPCRSGAPVPATEMADQTACDVAPRHPATLRNAHLPECGHFHRLADYWADRQPPAVLPAPQRPSDATRYHRFASDNGVHIAVHHWPRYCHPGKAADNPAIPRHSDINADHIRDVAGGPPQPPLPAIPSAPPQGAKHYCVKATWNCSSSQCLRAAINRPAACCPAGSRPSGNGTDCSLSRRAVRGSNTLLASRWA